MKWSLLGKVGLVLISDSSFTPCMTSDEVVYIFRGSTDNVIQAGASKPKLSPLYSKAFALKTSILVDAELHIKWLEVELGSRTFS